MPVEPDPHAYKAPRKELRDTQPRTTMSASHLASRLAMMKLLLSEGELLVRKGLLSKAEQLFSSAIRQRGKDIES
jgi:hypothetical protein